MTEFSQPSRRRFLGTAAGGLGALAGIGVSGSAPVGDRPHHG